MAASRGLHFGRDMVLDIGIFALPFTLCELSSEGQCVHVRHLSGHHKRELVVCLSMTRIQSVT